tara:strand:- start:159 stop:629 length:471 start_codon:yes stop_codon:yes gene_type:complete
MPKTSCVYILYNVEGYYYIGQTINLSQRLREHRSCFRLNSGTCASKKLGADWDCEVLEECDSDELRVAERFYYDFYHEISPEHCVNIDKPMRTDAEYVKENAEKIKKTRREYGLKHPDKYCEKRREYKRQWQINNKEKCHESQRKSREKKLATKLT